MGTQLIASTDKVPYSFNWQNAPAGEHIISVRATDSKGAIAPSTPVKVKLEIVTGKNNFHVTESTTNIYPNPSQNELQINSESDLTDATIKVIDALGGEVNVQSIITGYKAKLDLSTLTNGPYIILINLNNSLLTKQITVNR